MSGNAPSLNVQNIILKSPTGTLHRNEYSGQVMTGAVGQQQPSSSPGTVSVSRIPTTRPSPGPVHEPPHMVSLAVVSQRYPDPSPRFREPLVEVARLPGSSPAAAASLSPVARGHEPETAHMPPKQHFDLVSFFHFSFSRLVCHPTFLFVRFLLIA